MMEKPRAEGVVGAQTVRRALTLLRLVAAGQEQGLRLTDLVAMSGLSRPTVHRLMKALIDESAVEQNSVTRRYRVGTEMLLLGLARPSGLPIRAVAEPYLRSLAQGVGDTVFLSVRHGADSVCVARYPGHHQIQVLAIEVGARRPLGASVSGVVLLAGEQPDVARALIQANAARLALLNVAQAGLQRRVQQAREVGHHYVAQGVMPGTSAMAVPVLGSSGQVTAAISVAALAARLGRPRMTEVLAHMREQSAAITRRLVEIADASTASRRRSAGAGNPQPLFK